MFSVYKFFSLGKISNCKKYFYIQYITAHMVLKSTHPKTHEKLAFLLEGIRGQVDSDNSILTIFESTVYSRYNRHVHILHFKTMRIFCSCSLEYIVYICTYTVSSKMTQPTSGKFLAHVSFKPLRLEKPF